MELEINQNLALPDNVVLSHEFVTFQRNVQMIHSLGYLLQNFDISAELLKYMPYLLKAEV